MTDMTALFAFDTTYADLPDRFWARQAPTPVSAPRLLALNDMLARDLGLDPAALRSDEGLAALSGNALPDGAAGLAQAYAGHQFGGFVPQLGDGRALLLGEVVTPAGARVDLQLKGSGRTPFSRMGDGRAWLGPVLREYVVSEAMHALGVPTTRALAAVATGERVQRETALPGAVLTRVASSHIRVGTFEYFAARRDVEALAALADYARARHYPDRDGALGLLRGVAAAQARLVAKWMGLGFIHGVMNTDNCAVSGETIDYGPCAFMDAYHPMRVFSSIDRGGRYAYARQPEMVLWNLAQLASALLPVIGDRDAAQVAIDAFPDAYRAEWLAVFRAKLGLVQAEDGDADLAQGLLDLMARDGADFTRLFRALPRGAGDEVADRDAFAAWERDWHARLAREDATPADRAQAMDAANPALIPRNHRIEEMIAAAVAGDMAPFERLTAALSTPFDLADADADLARAPTEDQVVSRTFCGT